MSIIRGPVAVRKAMRLLSANRFRNAGPKGRHGIAKHDVSKKKGR